MLDSLGRDVPHFSDIADGVIRGDASACRTWVERFTGPFQGTLIKQFGFSKETAHDITQDTLFAIVRHLQSGEIARSQKELVKPTRWAFTWLERKAIDHLRRKEVQRRHVRAEHEGAPFEAAREEAVAQGHNRPESILDDRERQEMAEKMRQYVREEIAKTTGQMREILDLLLSGMPLAEIARKLHLKPGTCNSYYIRARDRIVANAQARALGLSVPKAKEVTREALSDTFSRLPKHQRAIARAACLDGPGSRPEEIARKTGYALDVVQANLEDLWDFLSRRYHRDFPEALNDLAHDSDSQGPAPEPHRP